MGSGISTRNGQASAQIAVAKEGESKREEVQEDFVNIRNIPSSEKSSPNNIGIHRNMGDTAASNSPHRSFQHDDGQVDEEQTEEERREQQASAEFFAHTALALGMESEDDLLFNLLYFEEVRRAGDQGPSFGSIMDSVQQETLALHSSGNTPYKLQPASAGAIAGLAVEIYQPVALAEEQKQQEAGCECAVCRDELEGGCEAIRLPACAHVFHADCLVRWIKLVSLPAAPAAICATTCSN